MSERLWCAAQPSLLNLSFSNVSYTYPLTHSPPSQAGCKMSSGKHIIVVSVPSMTEKVSHPFQAVTRPTGGPVWVVGVEADGADDFDRLGPEVSRVRPRFLISHS